MTDTCEIEIEVGGSIVISNTEEAVIDSRGVNSSAMEAGSAEEKTSRRHTIKKFVMWKTFKSIVFLICLIVFIMQSVEFLTDYCKYPTKIETEITVANELKLPAVTFCFRNTMSYQKFCSYEPELCERPRNTEEFCRKHEYDFDCRRNKSNVQIPKQDYEFRDYMQGYLFNDSYNDDETLFWWYRYTSKVRTFVRDIYDSRFFLKCYSENLHLYQSGAKLETIKLKFDKEMGDSVSVLVLDQVELEPFYPKDKPQVFVAIHSPYLPVDANKLHAIMPETVYNIDVQLEKEEHLLPPPYQTDCRDNGPSKDAKESTNPNSHQMCLDMCRSEYAKAVSGCDWALTMNPSPNDSCSRFRKIPDISSEQEDELKKKRLFCFQNCKQGCLKLHYKSTIKELDITNDYQSEKYSSKISFYVKNPEVTVLRHVPVYGSGDVFSHIGGLLGCWLGISVFTFTDILEKFFRKVGKWKRTFRKRKFTSRRFRKRKVQRAPQTSEIHQD